MRLCSWDMSRFLSWSDSCPSSDESETEEDHEGLDRWFEDKSNVFRSCSEEKNVDEIKEILLFPNFISIKTLKLFVVCTQGANLVILEVQYPQLLEALQERLLQAVYPVVAQIEDLQARGQATGKRSQLFFFFFEGLVLNNIWNLKTLARICLTPPDNRTTSSRPGKPD